MNKPQSIEDGRMPFSQSKWTPCFHVLPMRDAVQNLRVLGALLSQLPQQ